METQPTKPCVVCNKQLECAVGKWDSYQPYDGGEICLSFSYGSAKFDLGFNTTVYRGLICDDCAEKLVNKMDCISPARKWEDGDVSAL